jgi:hypothetical protein
MHGTMNLKYIYFLNSFSTVPGVYAKQINDIIHCVAETIGAKEVF